LELSVIPWEPGRRARVGRTREGSGVMVKMTHDTVWRETFGPALGVRAG
jgi:hypothetical protein